MCGGVCYLIELYYKQFLFWRIGNGNLVNIWKDKSIESTLSNQIQSPISHLHLNSTDLMDKQNHCWSTALIQEIFSPNEVQAILAIPISPIERPDKLVWFHSNDGHFTVRSAYHLQHAISLNC